MAKYTLTRDGMNPIETDREDVRLQYAAAGYKTTINEPDDDTETTAVMSGRSENPVRVDVVPNGDQDTDTVTPGYGRGGRVGRG